MEIRTDNIVFTISADYLPHVIVGLLLLGAAGFCRGIWIQGWTNWTAIFQHIDPSLDAAPSPFDQSAIGCAGLFAAFICSILTVVFSVLAVDQLVFRGVLWIWLMGRVNLSF